MGKPLSRDQLRLESTGKTWLVAGPENALMLSGSPKVGILIADGVKAESLAMTRSRLAAAGVDACMIGLASGAVRSADGQEFDADVVLDDALLRRYQALVLPDGAQAVEALGCNSRTAQLMRSQYDQGAAVLALGASSLLLERLCLAGRDPERVFLCGPTCSHADLSRFIQAVVHV